MLVYLCPKQYSVGEMQVDLPEPSARKQKLASKLSMVPPGVSGPCCLAATLDVIRPCS